MAKYLKLGSSPPSSTQFGTGLTKRTITKTKLSLEVVDSPPDADELEKLARLLRESLPSPHERLHKITEWASAALRSERMPDRDGWVIETDDGWQWVPNEQILSHLNSQRGVPFHSALLFAQRDEESKSWFAAAVLLEIEKIRPRSPQPGKRKKKASAGATFEAGLQIGKLLERFRWKLKYEKFAMDGIHLEEGRRKGQKDGAKGARNKGAKTANAIIKATAKAWQEHPGLRGNQTRTADHLLNHAKQYFGRRVPPLSESTVKRAIRAGIKRGTLVISNPPGRRAKP